MVAGNLANADSAPQLMARHHSGPTLAARFHNGGHIGLIPMAFADAPAFALA